MLKRNTSAPWVKAALAVAMGLLLLGTFAFFVQRSEGRFLLQVSPAQSGGVPLGRCPPGTLEEDGLCVPVPIGPKTAPQTAIAKLPERPTQLSAYRLPVTGEANWVDLEQAEVPLLFRVQGQALVVNTAEGVPLGAPELAPFDQARVVAYSISGGWLLLCPVKASDSEPWHLVLIAGLSELSNEVQPGRPLPSVQPLARTSPALWLAARQVLPGHEPPFSARDWQANRSVAQDLRNLLQLVHTP